MNEAKVEFLRMYESVSCLYRLKIHNVKIKAKLNFSIHEMS